MFVYYYVYVRQPFETVERRLMGLLSGLGEMAAAAYREGEILRARIGVGGTQSPLLAKKVRIEVGEPLFGDTETEVPIRLKATGTPGLFPSMEAGIVLTSLGPELTQITLRGSYDPPLGVVGRAIDRTLLHRIAETSVKSLVDRIARSIDRDDFKAVAER